VTHVETPAERTGDGHWGFFGHRTELVGRVRELHRLRETLRNVIDGRLRRAVLVLGPAGIGKSRLISEFCETAEAHVDKVTVLSSACRPDGGPAYSIFRRLLLQRFYLEPGAPDDLLRAGLQQGLTQVLKDDIAGEEAAHFIGHLLGLPVAGSPHIARVDADPRRIEERAVALFTQVVRMDAHRVPMVLAIDDLQFATDESISLLLRLAQGLNDAPVMFLATSRQTFGEQQSHFIEGMRAVGEVMELAGLPDKDCRRIVSTLLAGADTIPEEFIRQASEKALGNPFQLEQIVQLQVESGAIERSGDGWQVHPDRLVDVRIPGTLRDVVKAKLARLGVLERGILEKAAVVGDVFWTGCVEMLRRVDEGHAWEEADRFWNTTRRSDELSQVLQELRRREIVLRAPQSSFPASRELSFKHTLERELLYESIEGPRRARYHRSIAQWLEMQGQDRTTELAELVALHWERGFNPRKAANHYLIAADRAREAHLNQKAVNLYRKAVECLSEDEAAGRADVFHKLGKVHMTLGDHAEALGHFQEMLRLSWLLDDARTGGLAYNKMGQSYRALGEYELALAHFKNGLALFRQIEDVRGIAASADDIGRVFLARGDLDRAMDRFQEGLRLRRFLSDDRSVAVSLQHVGSIHAERGDFREAVSVLREALDRARKCADQRTVADNLNNLAVVCYQRGEHEKAVVLWTEALDIARALGERSLEGMLLTNLGEASLVLGQHEESRDRLFHAVALLESVGDRRSLAEAQRNLGSVFLKLDDYPKALEYSMRALEVAREVGARAMAGMAERNLGEVYSRTLFDDLAERDARIELSARHFEASIRELEEIGALAELGKSLLAHGSFLAEVGRVDESRAQLERARDVFTRLDMRDNLERADRVLAVL
jgi:tetratricopeptide (TPR) repeat protein